MILRSNKKRRKKKGKNPSKMVDIECPMSKTVAMQDRHLSDCHKAGVPLSLCIHLRNKGLSLGDAVWTARRSKPGFSISFYWDQCKTGTEKADSQKKMKKRKE